MKIKTASLLCVACFLAGLGVGIFSTLQESFSRLTPKSGASAAAASQTVAKPDAMGLYSAVQVKKEIHALGDNPSAEKAATCLAEIDSWPSKPEDESEIEKLKLQLATDLRKTIVREVTDLQTKARTAATGRDGAEALSKAGQILALYPLSQDQSVADEARKLSAQQGETAVRVESVRRLRYNHWAAERAEATIKGYHDNSSYIPGRTDKPKLIELCAKELGQVDPSYLEPAVLDLYSYALELIKGSISEDEKITLAKRLADPASRRVTISDF